MSKTGNENIVGYYNLSNNSVLLIHKIDYTKDNALKACKKDLDNKLNEN